MAGALASAGCRSAGKPSEARPSSTLFYDSSRLRSARPSVRPSGEGPRACLRLQSRPPDCTPDSVPPHPPPNPARPANLGQPLSIYPSPLMFPCMARGHAGGVIMAPVTSYRLVRAEPSTEAPPIKAACARTRTTRNICPACSQRKQGSDNPLHPSSFAAALAGSALRSLRR